MRRKRVIVRFRAERTEERAASSTTIVKNGVFVLEDIREWTIFVDRLTPR